MKLVIFDLDHTLLTANSSFKFGSYLYQQNFFSFWTLLACLYNYGRHKLCGMPLQALHFNSFSRLFKGRSLSNVQTHVEAFLNENLDALLFKPVVQRLKAAQNCGDYVLILSSSPDFLVGEIARRLGVEQWKATSYQIDCQGIFSNISHVMEGGDKADYVVKLAHLLPIPLSATVAYSDSALDLPVLKIVGKAIGVVPDPHLKRICLQNGWEIISANT